MKAKFVSDKKDKGESDGRDQQGRQGRPPIWKGEKKREKGSCQRRVGSGVAPPMHVGMWAGNHRVFGPATPGNTGMCRGQVSALLGVIMLSNVMWLVYWEKNFKHQKKKHLLKANQLEKQSFNRHVRNNYNY